MMYFEMGLTKDQKGFLGSNSTQNLSRLQMQWLRINLPENYWNCRSVAILHVKPHYTWSLWFVQIDCHFGVFKLSIGSVSAIILNLIRNHEILNFLVTFMSHPGKSLKLHFNLFLKILFKMIMFFHLNMSFHFHL